MTGRGAAAEQTLQVLLEAREQVWRIECSALLLGRRFVDTCRSLDMDAHRLPAERRQAIDQAMAALPMAESEEALLAALRCLLLQPLN